MVELCQQSLERQAVTLHTMNVVTVKTQQLLHTAYIGNVYTQFSSYTNGSRINSQLYSMYLVVLVTTEISRQ